MAEPPEEFSASELGEYGYCRRAWWLGHVAGCQSANAAQMAAGTTGHRRHGRGVQRASAARRLAWVLLALAGLAALVLLALLMAGGGA